MKVITFKDLYKLTGAPSYELTPYLVNEDSSTLGEILLNRNLISQAKSNIIELDPYINKLFLALCERHWDRSVVAECEDEDYEEEITSVLLRLINEIDFSYTYFSTLLRNYDSQAGEFIKQIMSTSSNQN